MAAASAAKWVVHKFGGTSVANAARYRDVLAVLDREPGARKAVVVSAMAKVTDGLIALLELARARDEVYRARLDALRERHVEAARELLGGLEAERLAGVFEADCADLAGVLRGVWLARGYSEAVLELVAGHGEVWSAQLLAARVREEGRGARWLDARDVLTVRPAEIGPVVDDGVSRAALAAWLGEARDEWLVITGYVARTPDGAPTTLERNGSDFSASIFGSLLDAGAITIWTDVDGVLSADPRRVPEAVVLDTMSYDEAMELAYFGAKVLHPRTMAPAVAQGIPIWIRNTFNPSHPGTKIHRRDSRAVAISSAAAVKGFSTIDAVALINVEGTGMVGVPGVAQRIFTALREVSVSVVMISQASSEHSVCFAVPEAQGALARDAVARAFADEVHKGEVETVDLVPGCSVLAAVGDGMAQRHGVAARLFTSLDKAGVNVRAIAQGSSERNLSVVIAREDSTRALRAVHAGFYLSDQTLSVGIIGPGLVGSALLAQLEAQAPILRSQLRIDLRVRGVLNRAQMLLGLPDLAPGAWRERMAREGVAADLAIFTDHVASPHRPHAVIIDCTASDEIADRYLEWLERGIHVITPNKRAGAGPLARYLAIRALGRARRVHFFYEATVGAGLPVITTLRDLIQTGDRVVRIEAVMSGTLSYVFNTFTGATLFSDVVREARRLGYTEPDPRDDLSGLDVARKLVILGREIGLALELDAVQIEGLVPDALRSAASPEAFLDGLRAFDAQMTARRSEAAKGGGVLRYVGVLHADGRAEVALRVYPATHPFAGLSGSDNVFAFTTERYMDAPLVVQGHGAGPEVTAGGIFGDVLRLANYLGAPT